MSTDMPQATKNLSTKVQDTPPKTLESFFIEVDRRAYKVALMSTKKQADALDIVQDAMVQMVAHYANHNPDEWRFIFHRVLNNKIMDWHRQMMRRKRWFDWMPFSASEDETDDQTFPEISDDKSDPSRMLENLRSMEAVVSLVEALPTRQQQVVMLRVWEGFDVKETAAIMACSEGSVKTHLSRALERLRQGLEAW